MAVSALLAGLALAGISSCNGSEDKNFLEKMFDIEARSSKNAPPSTVKELKDGISRYGGEVDKTVKSMEKIAMYWRLLAVKYMERGLFGDAYDAALVALRHYPQSSGLYYVAGMSAAYLSKAASAETGVASRASWLAASEGSYKRAIEFDARNTKALYGLAVLYTFELGDHESALAPLEAYLAIGKKDVDALFVYARALYGSGRLQDAADAYDRVIATTTIDSKKQQAAENKKRILDELYGK
jgi:tetratricopeptide (TPR) repeat protein